MPFILQEKTRKGLVTGSLIVSVLTVGAVIANQNEVRDIYIKPEEKKLVVTAGIGATFISATLLGAGLAATGISLAADIS